MKKLLCLMLSALMILSSVSALAATDEFGAYSDKYATNIYIEGKAELGGQAVTIIFTDGDNIGYINEIKADADGAYSKKFKFNGDISGYDIRVRDSATSADITNTLETAIAQKDIYSVDIDLKVGDNDVIHYIKEGDFLNVVADIENKYADSKKVSIMIAAYDENNTLLFTKISTVDIGYYDVETKKEVGFEEIVLPTGAVKAKAFAWLDTVDLIPVTKEETKVTYEDGLLFGSKNTDPDNTWVVGLAGASTVHAGQYAAYLFQYYATRHPDKNIVILNKGAAGCTAFDIYNRLEWDIFNENDPMGYGACDEIAIMVGANDVNYTGYANGKMDEDEYESFYNGINVYTNHPVASKNGQKVTNMTAEVEDSFNNYKKIVEKCKELGKGVIFTPMTLHDDSEDFEHILYDVGNVYGANHAFGMLSDRLEKYAAEQTAAGFPITFIDSWGMSDEYTKRIRANTDPDVVNYIKSKKGYVFLGKDGLHHSPEGGYLIGYLIARGQETDPIVAAVDIDATTSSVSTEDATVTDLTVSSSNVSYTYLADAIPMYVKAPGYIHGEKLGMDLTGTVNQEIIKVSGLEDGLYKIAMDGEEVIKVTAAELAAGVNIATLEKNPGQIQAKNLFVNYSEKRKSNENTLRDIFNEELRLRNKNTSKTLWNSNTQKQITNQMYMEHNDPRYAEYTEADWLALNQYFIDNGSPTTNAETYPAKKKALMDYVNIVRECIEGMRTDGVPVEHTVVITKL